MDASTPHVLRVRGIRKHFGQVKANDGVDFDLQRGEIHAIVGENGAGKSTLMQILYGAFRPDAGEIQVDGQPVAFLRPRDALDHGIGLVHQHLLLIPEFTIAQNVTLGASTRRFGLIDDEGAARELTGWMARLGITASPATPVGRLSMAQQQRVEILKVLARGARVVLLDEPTAVLTPQETDELFDLLRELTRDGYSIVFISHKLREVMSLADRVTVLRAGRTRGTSRAADVDIPTLVEQMTGRDDLSLGRPERRSEAGQCLLEVEDLRGRSGTDCPINGLTLSVRSGEIVGVASVDGNGEHSLVALLTGAATAEGGHIRLGTDELTGRSIAERRALGVAHVPEDRHADGLPLHGTVAEALVVNDLSSTGMRASLGVAMSRARRGWAQRQVEAFGIRTASIDARCQALSGGNQQKIVVARELAAEPRLIVMAQPTRGVDLPAAHVVHAAIQEVVAQGAAAVIVSADLDELLQLTDRIVVLYRGEIAATLPAAGATREQIGAHMMGGTPVESVA